METGGYSDVSHAADTASSGQAPPSSRSHHPRGMARALQSVRALVDRPGTVIVWALLTAVPGYLGFHFTQVVNVRLQANRVEPPVALPQWLVISDESLDFGEVWLQEGFRLTLPIRNAASDPVQIVQLSSSCGCAVVAPASVNIPPGESRDVTLTLNLGFGKTATPEKDAYPFAATLFAEAQLGETGSAAVFSWEIHGQVRRAFYLSQQSVDFGDAVTLGQTPKAASVSVQRLAPLERLLAECDPAQASVAIESDSTEAGNQSERLLITPSPHLPQGPFSFTVKVRAQTTGGELLPPQAIAVKGEVMPNVRASPRTIDFGVLSVGQKRGFDLTLWSSDDSAFSLSGTRVHEGVRVVPATAPDAPLHVVQVVAAPETVGRFSRDVTIDVTNAADSSVDYVTIRMQGYVVPQPPPDDKR